MSDPCKRVECACGWQGKRKPGNPVQCPRCGGFASYQEE